MKRIHANKSYHVRLGGAIAAVQTTPGPADKLVSEFFKPNERERVNRSLRNQIVRADDTYARGRIRAAALGENDLWGNLWKAVDEVRADRDPSEVVNKLIPKDKRGVAMSLMFSFINTDDTIFFNNVKLAVRDVLFHA